MKRYRNSIYYVSVIGFFIVLIYIVGQVGKGTENAHGVQKLPAILNHWDEIVRSFTSSLSHPLIILFAQIIVIILVTRIFGWICKKLRQPVVIGEIIAGILLGPSLVGYYFPGFSAALFPVHSLENLHMLAQIGLVLFMFMVGMELDFSSIRNNARKALIISHTGIVFSFSLGMLLALSLYPTLAPHGVSLHSFGLFLGISLSITAFPVLARIMQERGIHKTKLGIFVMVCAAIDDLTAWSMLAVIIAIIKAGSFVSAVPTILLSVLYVLIMLKVIRPFLARIGELRTSRETLTKPVVALFFLMLILSAFATEFIGIHAVFGGFLAGAIMPDNVKFRNIFIDKVEDVALVLFLPLFFVYAGLRTEITLLNEPGLWKITGVIILVAITGKFLGVTLASRFAGQTWKESVIIGNLMNSRGLVQLVVLNIGYDLGIFSSRIFAMLVIMALVTTIMTSPILELINRLFGKEPGLEEAIGKKPMEKFKLLLSFGNPESGKSMMRLAASFVKNGIPDSSVTALHLSPVDDMFQSNMDNYESESFAPLLAESGELNIPVKTIFKMSNNTETDIAEIANQGDFNLLIMGVGHSIYEGSFLGKMIDFTSQIINPVKIFNKVTGKEKSWFNPAFDVRTRAILSMAKIPVGIFLDKKIHVICRVFVMIGNPADAFLSRYARLLSDNGDVHVTLFFSDVYLFQQIVFSSGGNGAKDKIFDQFEILTNVEIREELLKNHDLLLISTSYWTTLVEKQQKWLMDVPSTLIIST